MLFFLSWTCLVWIDVFSHISVSPNTTIYKMHTKNDVLLPMQATHKKCSTAHYPFVCFVISYHVDSSGVHLADKKSITQLCKEIWISDAFASYTWEKCWVHWMLPCPWCGVNVVCVFQLFAFMRWFVLEMHACQSATLHWEHLIFNIFGCTRCLWLKAA